MKASYLNIHDRYKLNQCCRIINEAFDSVGIFQVGSSLTTKDYRDIDLRCILDDKEYDKIFTSSTRLEFLNAVISDYLRNMTALPIDFQFQRMTNANKDHKGTRCSIGYVIKKDEYNLEEA